MVSPPLRPPAFALLGLLLGVGGSPGCAGEPAGPAVPVSSGPRWEGHGRELFDDNIDPSAVGLSMDAANPRMDPLLRERSQTGELVARLRVQTVTVGAVGEETTYHLGVAVGFPTLTPGKLTDRTVELQIRSNSPAFGVVKQFDARLRGRTFIGFLHRFAGEDGEPAIHWHLSADTADVGAAVKEAVALREISGS